jgi:alkylation response protein AidB-like acyl-CoA dehydrogenase
VEILCDRQLLSQQRQSTAPSVELKSEVHLIRSDDEAILVAQELATEFARDASERDQKRRLPSKEIELSSRSGIWGITVPREYGGAGLSVRTVAEVIATISAADPSIGQIPQNHFFFLQLIRTNGSKEQKQFFSIAFCEDNVWETLCRNWEQKRLESTTPE